MKKACLREIERLNINLKYPPPLTQNPPPSLHYQTFAYYSQPFLTTMELLEVFSLQGNLIPQPIHHFEKLLKKI
jgi:hypothetical protein